MPREILDLYGRRYRLDETDRELLGRPRTALLPFAVTAMAAVGLLQYGLAATLPTLAASIGRAELLTVLAVWVACQAGIAPFAAALYRRSSSSLAAPLLTGAVLCGAALITLGRATATAPLLAGYSVLGGLGTGLVYVTCIGVVSDWFPERVAARTGLVSAAFAAGAAPFALVVALAPGTLPAAGLAVAAVLAIAATRLRKPPAHWWPSDVDPRRWAVDPALNPSVGRNIPAVRAWSASAAARTRALPAMCLVVLLTSALALFDLAYLGAYPAAPGLPVAAITVLALATGAGRVVTSTLSDRLGRRRTLSLALTLGAAAQFGLLTSLHAGNGPGLLLFAALAGAGTGTGYSLMVTLVRDFFGGDAHLPTYGLTYAAKAVGGPLGVGLAALLLTAPHTALVTATAGALGLLGAALTLTLRQPGRPATLPSR